MTRLEPSIKVDRAELAWAMAAKSLPIVIGALTTVGLARVLSVDSFGIFAIGIAVVTIGAALLDMGGSAATAKFIAEGRPGRLLLLRASAAMWLVTSLLGTAIIVSAISALTQILRAPMLEQLAPYLALSMAAKLGQTRIQKVAEGMRRNDLVVKYSVRFSWLAPMLAVTLSILQGGSVQAAFLGYSIGHLVLFSTALFGVGREVVAGSLTRDFFQGPFSARQRAVARRLIRYSGPQAGIGMSLVIYNNSGVLLIQRFLGSTDAGQYALAMRLIEMLALPGMAAGSATGPLFATGGDDVWRRALNLSSRLAVLYIPVGVAAYLFLPTVLTRFVGPQYAQASAVVIWLQPFLVLRVLASFYGAILDYLGAGYRRVAVVMTTTALFIASGVAVLPHVGLGGAVVVTTLTYLPLVAAYAFMIVGHANRGKNRFVRPEAEVLGPSATVITDRMPVDMSGSVSVS